MGRRPTWQGHTLARAAGLAAALIAGVAFPAGAIGTGAAPPTEVAARTGQLAGGPQLVGGRTAYLVYGRRDYRILAAAPGAPPSVLYRAGLAPGVGAFGAGDLRHLSENVSFVAADGWIAVETAIRGPSSSSRASVSLSVGMLGHRLLGIDGCSVRHQSLRLQAVAGPYALSGGLLAYVPAACRGKGLAGDGLVLLDLATGKRTPLAAGPDAVIEAVRVAGRYVAFTPDILGPDTRSLVVYDRSLDRVAYRSALGFAAGNVAIDVDQAGRTAIVISGPVPPEGCLGFLPSLGMLELATVDHPQPVLLPEHPCSAPPRLVGDRIVFVASTSDGFHLLTSTGLTGAQTTDLASLGTAGMSAGPIDADPTEAVYALTACDGRSVIERVALSPPARIVTERPDCPVRRPTTVQITPGAATVRLDCPRGCRGGARLEAPSRAALSSARFTIHGATATLRLALPAAARRTACASTGLRFTLTVDYRDDGLEPARRSWLLARHGC